MMTEQRTIDELVTEPTGEFEHLRNQRRFERADSDAPLEAAAPAAPTRRTPRKATRKRAARPVAATTTHEVAPAVAPVAAPAPEPAHEVARAQVAAQSRAAAPRLSHEPYTAIVELSRMADRVIDSREQLAAHRARADRAERDLANLNQRIMAARAIVFEAQRVSKLATERTSYLEGRCTALEGALDQVLHASMFERLRWRRMLRRQ